MQQEGEGEAQEEGEEEEEGGLAGKEGGEMALLLHLYLAKVDTLGPGRAQGTRAASTVLNLAQRRAVTPVNTW